MRVGLVVFRYKQRSADESWRTMELDAVEFLRRFSRHVLPKGFIRIRYWGLLANRNRREKLAICRQQLGVASAEPQPDGGDPSAAFNDEAVEPEGLPPLRCPECGEGRLIPRLLAPAKRRSSGIRFEAPHVTALLPDPLDGSALGRGKGEVCPARRHRLYSTGQRSGDDHYRLRTPPAEARDQALGTLRPRRSAAEAVEACIEYP